MEFLHCRFETARKTPCLGLSTISLDGMSIGPDKSDTENRKRRNKLAKTTLISKRPYFCPEVTVTKFSNMLCLTSLKPII